ncbi:MAG: LAGLIDADG family homing endonuclease [Candidatus Woesearchaeota archaeon]
MLTGPWIKVPEKIKNYNQIKNVIAQLTPKSELYLAYILGVIVGDASNHGIKRKNRIARRIQLRLTTKYKTNKEFGGYVSYCLRNLKIRIHRTKNCPRRKRNPNEFYAWHSQCSSLIDWILKACLGINDNELTTYNKIKANWILKTPKKFRIAFLQGIVDSDGYVDITQYRAGIVTKPNAKFIQDIFNSLNIKSNMGSLNKGNLEQVKIRLEDANKLPLFNPRVNSYRYQLMKKAIKAKKLKHHWPKWFGNEINTYLRQGLSSTKIINSVLNKHNIIIRTG